MDKNTVLIRTPKGNDEVENRTHKINIRLRAALLAVNGTETLEAILKRFHGLEGIAQALKELESQGFLATAGATRGRATVSTAQPDAGLDDAVRTISQRVHELLGPDSDVITERLEEAAKQLKQIQPIVQYLEQRRDMFEGIAGKQKTAAFFEGLHKLANI